MLQKYVEMKILCISYFWYSAFFCKMWFYVILNHSHFSMYFLFNIFYAFPTINTLLLIYFWSCQKIKFRYSMYFKRCEFYVFLFTYFCHLCAHLCQEILAYPSHCCFLLSQFLSSPPPVLNKYCRYTSHHRILFAEFLGAVLL